MLTDEHGGKVIYGGRAIDKDSRFIGPTVVETPRKDSLMMQEEIFGPILPLLYFNDLQALTDEIAARPKPLVVYHFSESSRNTELVQSRTYSGAYVVNDTVVQMTNLHLPFGGVGGSGYGRFHGKDGFLGFSNPKSIARVSSMDSFPLNQRYPPYTESKKALMTKLLKFSTITYGQIARVTLFVLLLVAVVLMVLLIPKW
jgi:aldehyde dehydrogenase (NAD+)